MSVVEILMERDYVSRSEAEEMVENCRSELLDAMMGTSCMDPEDVIMDELGLEPDYMEEILDGI